MNEQEKVVAMRIVENYKEMFDFLDFNPVDDLLNAEELSQAFKDFGIYLNYSIQTKIKK